MILLTHFDFESVLSRYKLVIPIDSFLFFFTFPILMFFFVPALHIEHSEGDEGIIS